MKAIKRLFYAMGMATLIGFFAILTSYTNEGFLELDLRTMEWFFGNSFLKMFSVFGERVTALIVSLALMIFLWAKRQNYRGMLFVFLTVGLGNALSRLMEYFFVQERPDLPEGLETFGFPSTHAVVGLVYLFTAAYFLTGLIQSLLVRWLTWIAVVLLVIGAGLSQVAAGVHFFSDVLAGWFIAYSLFAAVAVWYEMRERSFSKREQEKVEE